MFHFPKLIAAIVVFAFVAAVFAQQGQAPKTLRVDIDLVLVNAAVTNSDSEAVTGLTADNFQLFEDKVQQDIRYFSSESTPVSLGIIFDSSHSMQRKIDFARNAAVTCLENGTTDDEYFLVEFNNRARVAQDFTTDILRLQNHLVLVPPQGSTAMYDALYLGLSKVKKGQNAKKALLLITDGEDNNSRYSRHDIREFVREADVQIYSIDLGRALID